MLENVNLDVTNEDKTKEYENTIEKLKKEVASLKATNNVSIDLSNDDNRKKLIDLMNEGKILVTDNNRKFIAAKQNRPIYDQTVPVIHKIYVDEIKSIIIKSYFEDYELQEKGNRTLIKRVIWCYHNGYNVSSTLSEEDLKYLLDNNLITKNIIRYSDVDCSTGGCYASVKGEMTLKEMEAFKDGIISNYNKQHNDKSDSDEDGKISKANDIKVVAEVTTEVQADSSNEESTNLNIELEDISLEDIAL